MTRRKLSWNKWTRTSLCAPLLGALISLACSSDDSGPNADPDPMQQDSSSSAVVGVEAASIEITGARLSFPAGSRSEDVTVTVSELSDDDADGLPGPSNGLVVVKSPVAFLPHGTQFDEPVEVVLTYSGSTPTRVLKLDDENDITWEEVPGATFGSGEAHFSVMSFSIYGLFRQEDEGTGGSSSGGASSGGASSGGTSSGGSSSGGASSGGAPASGGDSSGGASSGGAASTGGMGGGEPVEEPWTTENLGWEEFNSFAGDVDMGYRGGASAAPESQMPGQCMQSTIPMSSFPGGETRYIIYLNQPETGGAKGVITPTMSNLLGMGISASSEKAARVVLYEPDGTTWCTTTTLALGNQTRSFSYTDFTDDCTPTGVVFDGGDLEALALEFDAEESQDQTFSVCLGDLYETGAN